MMEVHQLRSALPLVPAAAAALRPSDAQPETHRGRAGAFMTVRPHHRHTHTCVFRVTERRLLQDRPVQ